MSDNSTEKQEEMSSSTQDRKLPDKKKKTKREKQITRKRVIMGALLLLIIVIAAAWFVRSRRAAAEAQTEISPSNLGTVMRGDIKDQLTASGSLEAGDTYTITSLVEGEIVEANFEEGDQVTEGQVLYRIEASDAQRQLQSAERDYEKTKSDYDRYLSQYESGVYRSTQSGYVTDITMKKGDYVGGQNGTVIATLYNDSVMELRLPFLSFEADAIPIGAALTVVINDTGEQIPGQVTEKSDREEALTGGTLVKYVTLIVSNPGGLTESDRATAQYGDIYSAGDGAFSAYQTDNLKCDLPISVEIDEILVSEGQYVSSGTALFSMTKESYEDAVAQLEDELTAAEDTYEQRQDTVFNYTITAPISGQVISKNAKVGDNIDRTSGSASTELAVIYDLSELTFEMSIDELDISNVKVGQEVEVTADAFPGVTYRGQVTNVSLNGSYQSGVTTYPVVVTLEETGDLLPGMNVDGTIILEEKEDVLYIPSGGLQRGDVVYVRNESLTATQSSASSGKSSEGSRGSETAPADMPESAPSAPALGEISERALAEVPDGFTAVKVETGLVTDDYVEIVSGLSEGQEIYVSETESGSMGMFGMMGGMTMTMTGGPGGGGPGGGPGRR